MSSVNTSWLQVHSLSPIVGLYLPLAKTETIICQACGNNYCKITDVFDYFPPLPCFGSDIVRLLVIVSFL